MKNILIAVLSILLINNYIYSNAKSDSEELFICLIFNILKYTPELNIHRMRGEEDNVVYLHKDGHREAVYDKNKNLVSGSFNSGSYNYANPFEDPLNHFSMDIYPWINWGNIKNDPTTKKERIDAYLKDIQIGFDSFKKTKKIIVLDTIDKSDKTIQLIINIFKKYLLIEEFDYLNLKWIGDKNKVDLFLDNFRKSLYEHFEIS